MSTASPFRLAPFFSPRPWGRTDWSRWYSNARFPEPVGEAWLTGEQCILETGPWAGQRFGDVVSAHRDAILGAASDEDAFPLLLKILSPKDKLSLQVHPDDAFAQQTGHPRGKTECWYVLDAEPDAAIALGLKDGVDAAAIRAAVADHTLEDKMQWLQVHAGEMIFVDAGTVHGIGPGMTLLETQQTCDITYRLYDYGRPRELHIDHALRVMKQHTGAGKVAPRQADGFVRLIQERYFTVDKFDLKPDQVSSLASQIVPQILVAVSGNANLVCTGEPLELQPGKAIVIPAGAPECFIQSAMHCTFIRAIPV